MGVNATTLKVPDALTKAMIENAGMRRMPGRPGARVRGLIHGRRARILALGTVAVTVGAMVLVAHTAACASTTLAESGGALPSDTRFYLDPYSAVGYWDAHNTANPLEPVIARKIGDVPSAIWFTSYDPGEIAGQVTRITSQAAAQGAVPVLVLYDIPEVNCSATAPNGAPSIADYESWAKAFASGLGGHNVIVIVEPDALSQQTCLNAQQAAARDGAIAYAGSAVRQADSNARVYFDAGNSGWNPPAVQAQRLAQADVSGSANGIFSNVSNFLPTAAEVGYDEQVLDALGNPANLHIVVDTSRNGNGPGTTWCDPAGRAIGQLPTADTGNPLVDAYLWVKDPGQADGCAAPAGAFDPELAYALVANGGGVGAAATKTSAKGTGTGTGTGNSTATDAAAAAGAAKAVKSVQGCA